MVLVCRSVELLAYEASAYSTRESRGSIKTVSLGSSTEAVKGDTSSLSGSSISRSRILAWDMFGFENLRSTSKSKGAPSCNFPILYIVSFGTW